MPRILRFHDRFNRCAVWGADFLHLAWGCRVLVSFWVDVLNALEEMVGLTLPRSPVFALLDYIMEIPPENRKLVGLLLLLAKRRAAMRWGRVLAPRFRDWLRDTVYCQEQFAVYWELMTPDASSRHVGSPLRTFLERGWQPAA
ncbi:hypothetical protein NDU88_005228 [Pleurodeles waltl]|uniref:Uncharacterized protein n=1 Tax=Pleurodeles waltl TaxID=8319 RepID=A0AAV7NLW9_PLEWA|nr:hypothetical protein NDU88_005228 [Pleurodeles waltl]